MKALVIEYPFGILAFNEENKLIGKMLFPKKPQETAKILLKVESGKLTSEIVDLINELKGKGYESFVFENANLANSLREKFDVNIEVSKVSDVLRSNMERFAVETGFVKDAEEFMRWMHSLSLETTKLRVKRAVEKKDLIVAQAIQTIDDLNKTTNLFMARVREWYGVHFPELNRLIDKHETYARLVFRFGGRENMTVEKLEEEGVPKTKAQRIVEAAEKSMGADLTEKDLKQVQNLCRNVLELYQLRQTLEDYLDEAMEEVAPNIKAIVGSLLGARLIAIAGGLTNLAKMPASTIQVLGAEKALFRSLKTGTRPPKHGIIFQHALLHDAKRWQRGKIARALAGKLAIAARMDAFGGRYMGDDLRRGLEERVEEIQEKYAQPTQVSKKGFKQKSKKKRRKRRHAGKG